MRSLWSSGVVVVAFVILCCTPEPAQGPISSAPSETPAASVIGPEGGTVSTSGGTSLKIPAGALAAGTKVGITPASAGDIAAGTVVGARYVLEPEGTTFAKPVTIIIPIDTSRLPSGKTASNVLIYIAPKGSHDFTPLPTKPVDASHVSAQTTHFSEVSPLSPIQWPAGFAPPAPIPTTPPTATTTPPPSSTGMTRDAPTDPKIAELPPTPVRAFQNNPIAVKDWVCIAHAKQPEQRFTNAAECMPKCLNTVTSKVICQLDPQCPDLKTGKQLANTYESLYQFAAGTQGTSVPIGMLGPYAPNATLREGHYQMAAAGWMLEKFFNQKATDFTMHVSFEANPSDYAHVDGAKAPFGLSISAIGYIQGTPGAMASTLGHEMIHVQQRGRPYHGPTGGLLVVGSFQALHDAMWEDEAYSWETGPTYGHTWVDHKDSTLRCGTTPEEAEAQSFHDCYDWKVKYLITKKVIEDDESVLPQIVAFLQQDPWGTVWQQQNADWKTWKTLPPAPVYQYTARDGTTATNMCRCLVANQPACSP